MNSVPGRRLTTEDVARRLGVKRETVYAYVSRGLLERHHASDHRRSLFDHDAVERLAARARRTDRSGALEVIVETELTLLDPAGRLSYRGHDAVELARFRSFEQVAALLWGVESVAPWELGPETGRLISAVSAALPTDVSGLERIPVIVAALGACNPSRGDRRPAAVCRVAATIFAGILDGLPQRQAPVDRSVAARLWAVLCAHERPPRPIQLAALNAALVLLADHELAASTLAARIAASAWADPYSVVLAGLGPLGGTLHGRASTAVQATLSSVRERSDVPQAVDQHLSMGSPPPGFGHRVYRDRDPRADYLLACLPQVAHDPSSSDMVAAFVAGAAAHDLPAPNVDLALGGLAHTMALAPGAASTIFTFARIAGLLAHALEEYPHRLRFRPRATYIGPSPPLNG